MSTSSPSVLDFELKWRLGARALILIYMTARRFTSAITLTLDGKTVDAKDHFALMCMGPHRPKLPDGTYNFGPDAGTPFRLAVEGPDASAAFAAMSDLFTCGERVVSCRNSDCLSTAILIDFDPYHIIYACSGPHMWVVNRTTGKTPAPKVVFRRR